MARHTKDGHIDLLKRKTGHPDSVIRSSKDHPNARPVDLARGYIPNFGRFGAGFPKASLSDIFRAFRYGGPGSKGKRFGGGKQEGRGELTWNKGHKKDAVLRRDILDWATMRTVSAAQTGRGTHTEELLIKLFGGA